jgi:hypothetical protein
MEARSSVVVTMFKGPAARAGAAPIRSATAAVSIDGIFMTSSLASIDQNVWAPWAPIENWTWNRNSSALMPSP